MSFARNELDTFPARLLTGLPCETRLHLEHPDFIDEIIFSSSVIPDRGSVAGFLFDGPEVQAIVAGVEADRVWPADVRGWLSLKRASATWRVTLADVLAGAALADARPATIAEVLARLGLELVRIEVLDPPGLAEPIRRAA